ncbi:MAG: PH domain-containing protein, partial [Euryarchaeota archaeon]|nr:PH domain-containing protein [Euryarchaeota archaeon]
MNRDSAAGAVTETVAPDDDPADFNFEWIIENDDAVESTATLGVHWSDTPLRWGGVRPYTLALGALLLAIALTRDTLAGVDTPTLTGIESYEMGVLLTTVDIPLEWVSGVPIAIGLVGVAIVAIPLVRSARTTYALTTDHLYVRKRGLRDDAVTKLPLERVVETACHQSLVGRLLSYGTVTFSTLEPDFPEVQCRTIRNPQQVHDIVLELDATAESPLDRTHEYIRVIPSTGERPAGEIVSQLRSLHTLDREDHSWWTRLNPVSGPDPLTFEFLIYSDGTDAPIEFYYTADQHLSTLHDRLRAAYPDTVTIERVTLDLAAKLVAPRQYSYNEFDTALANGRLQCTPAEVEALASVHNEQVTVTDGSGATDTDTEDDELADTEDTSLGTQLPRVDLAALRAQEDAQHRERGALTRTLKTPVDTGDGVLARPHPDEVEPSGVRWTGSGDQMTPIKQYTAGLGDEDRTKDDSHAPLTVLIDDFATTDRRIFFQAAFRGEADWSRTGEAHKQSIRHGRDTWYGTVAWHLRTVFQNIRNGMRQYHRRSQSAQGPPPVRSDRHHRSRTARQDAPYADDPRLDAIDSEDWAHTYTVNLRVVTVPTEPTNTTGDSSEINHYLRNLSTVFDPLEGDYYSINGETLTDTGILSRSARTRSRRCLNRVLDRKVVTGGRFSRSTPDLHLDPDELCNLVVVPSTEHLTEEAIKETHANPESRTALPGLDAAQRRQFTTGMVLGQDANSAVDGPLRLPPDRQTRHWLLCGTTGSGKTHVANRMLRSLAATTPGPNVLIEPKGDNMCLHYLMAHYKQFGTLDDVYYFREPETLPAISFFDIRPAIEAGHDRETAIKEKGDHFHELMRMIMGAGQHQQAFVANEILTFLIYALFDPVHGNDVFGLDDLVDAATTMQRDRELPELSGINDDIHDSLASQFEKDDHQFQTSMGAVLNRLNHLIEEPHLHWMLRYTPGRDHGQDDLYGFHDQDAHFEFGELLDEGVTILFDLGDLTLDAQRGFTTVLLSNLWHAIQRRRRADPENVVNVVIEEAAPFVATELVADQLLPQGRSSGLSLGLIMQYPEQVKSWDDADNGAYEELLTEVHTKIVGDISITDRFAETFTHDDLTVEDVRNRNNRMAAGEWFAKLVAPGFGEDRPAPLTMYSLPIVSGHPESDEPLSGAEQATFDEEVLPEVIERTQDEYGLYVPTHEDVMEYGEWGEIEREVGSPPPAPEDVGSGATSEAASGSDDGGDSREEKVADKHVREVDDDTRNEGDKQTNEGKGDKDEDASSLSMGSGFFGTEKCQIDDAKLRQRGLSRDDGIFLQRVLDAMNRELPGYSLLEGMKELKDDLDGLDIRVLCEQGLIEKETVNRRSYYTVLPAGRDLLGETVAAEPGIGDLGEKTPHKVGVELLFQ